MAHVLIWTLSCSKGTEWIANKVASLCGRATKPTYVQQPLSSEADQEGDLFCGVTQRTTQQDVVLRLETASAAEAKIRKSVTSFFVLLGYISLIILTVYKSVLWEKVTALLAAKCFKGTEHWRLTRKVPYRKL